MLHWSIIQKFNDKLRLCNTNPINTPKAVLRKKNQHLDDQESRMGELGNLLTYRRVLLTITGITIKLDRIIPLSLHKNIRASRCIVRLGAL